MKLGVIAYKIIGRIDRKLVFPIMASSRTKKLKHTDFTVISNNCWGGVCYEFFGMPKKTPTVGAYFYAEDFVKMCKDLKRYMSLELEIIPASESKHIESLRAKGEQTVLVGRLGDVEIIFLHYHEADELLAKWKRRVERINWDRVILKFSYQNECCDEYVREFLSIDEYPKFCLVGEKITGHKDEIVFSRANGKETVDETDNFGCILSPVSILNDRM